MSRILIEVDKGLSGGKSRALKLKFLEEFTKNVNKNIHPSIHLLLIPGMANGRVRSKSLSPKGIT